MKKHNYQLTRKEKKADKVNYIIFLGLALSFIIYWTCFRINIIGHDYRYFIYIFLIPTVSGIIILGYIKREFLFKRLNEAKGVFQKGFLILLYLLQGFMFSYFSIGLVANIVWDYSNKKTADYYSAETIKCHLIDIYSGTSKMSPSISFIFMGKHEILKIDHATYRQYFKSKPENLDVQLEIRKGIWNYYIIDDFVIKNNR
jgi:hypothetical protein